MRWAGHVVRTGDARLPKQLFYGQLRDGKRPQHKPRKRYKDCLKNNLVKIKINPDNWEWLALKRTD